MGQRRIEIGVLLNVVVYFGLLLMPYFPTARCSNHIELWWISILFLGLFVCICLSSIMCRQFNDSYVEVYVW